MRQSTIFAIFLLLVSCQNHIVKSGWVKKTAPDYFTVRFETTKGQFDVSIQRDASPQAVDRFYQLVRHHYFANAVFYRVIPDFVAQFGNSDTVIANQWDKHAIQDEKVILGNKRGTISFARSGKNSRSRELFFNLKDNPRLDTINYAGVQGFPVFGHVINGMEVVDSIYAGYSGKTLGQLDLLYKNRSAFLDSFPKLTLIKRVYLLKKKNLPQP